MDDREYTTRKELDQLKTRRDNLKYDLDNFSNKESRQLQKAETSKNSIKSNLKKIENKRHEIVNIENNLNSFNNDKTDFWKDFCIK
jgi:chromosome segregation ATPase